MEVLYFIGWNEIQWKFHRMKFHFHRCESTLPYDGWWVFWWIKMQWNQWWKAWRKGLGFPLVVSYLSRLEIRLFIYVYRPLKNRLWNFYNFKFGTFRSLNLTWPNFRNFRTNTAVYIYSIYILIVLIELPKQKNLKNWKK